MKQEIRIGKLNIMEPWEFGTEKAIEASVIDWNEGQYLFALSKPLSIKGKSISYLIGELREKESSLDLLSPRVRGTFTLNLVYSDEINRQNFKGYRLKDFRGNFLLGEIIFA